jgi:hypothetical protein
LEPGFLEPELEQNLFCLELNRTRSNLIFFSFKEPDPEPEVPFCLEPEPFWRRQEKKKKKKKKKGILELK